MAIYVYDMIYKYFSKTPFTDSDFQLRQQDYVLFSLILCLTPGLSFGAVFYMLFILDGDKSSI